MEIVNFTPLSALFGGMLIGLAVSLTFLINGKIAGLSGVFGRVFRFVPGDTLWRVQFLVGLIAGAAAVFALHPSTAQFELMATMPTMAIAGLLVGLGTRVGGGCTSGHGVCGIARGSVASAAATVTFIVFGVLTASVLVPLLGLR